MRIGIPREIKADENRVALLPVGAEILVRASHQVMVETQACSPSGSTDEDYRTAGEQIVSCPEKVYGDTDMVVKVKKPLDPEYGLLRPGQILFCYFHFVISREVTTSI